MVIDPLSEDEDNMSLILLKGLRMTYKAITTAKTKTVKLITAFNYETTAEPSITIFSIKLL